MHFVTLIWSIAIATYLTKPLPATHSLKCNKVAMHFIQILSIIEAIYAYYAGIMLNAFATLLCSKLC